MILRKPYAFFIKHFKLFHLILGSLVIYSIIRITGVISFVNHYINSNSSLITSNDLHKVFGTIDFVVPIITLLFSILLLVVMTMKKKKNKFYAFTTIMSITILLVNAYGYSTLKQLITVWLDINRVSTLGDIYVFVLFGAIIESAICLSRAIGFNVSRFDFNNDILELELSEKDNEEFEIMVDFDVNDLKRSAQKNIRYVKYFLKENKKTLLYSVLSIIGVVLLFIGFSYLKNKKDVVSLTKISSNINGFSMKVNNSYLINTDSDGNKYDNDVYLLILDVTIKNNDKKNSKQFLTGTLALSIGEDYYSVTKKYNVSEFGTIYNDEKIEPGRERRNVLVFEIPQNRVKSKILLNIKNLASKKDLYAKINPKDLSLSKNEKIEKNISEELLFGDNLENSKFKIDEYNVRTYFEVNYNYCTNDKKTCIKSLEYLIPNESNSNYDKVIMKLAGDFKISSNGIKDFYSLLKTYGYIEYELNGKTYIDKSFNQIKSSRIIEDNTYYLEVNSNVYRADKVVLGFKIRNYDYRYVLKEKR